MPPDELQAALTSIEREELERYEDPARALPSVAAERLGCGLGTFTAARYFHGTRTSDPDSFRELGLLPLGTRLEGIWDELQVICAGRLRATDFGRLRGEIERGGGGDGGHHYRLKTSDRLHHGPFGEYVREHLLRSRELNNHNYLQTPELVEDIAQAADLMFGVDLLGAYSAATRPCIVAFDMQLDEDIDAVGVACWYLRAAAGGEVTRNACGGFDGGGVLVPPGAIRDIEVTTR